MLGTGLEDLSDDCRQLLRGKRHGLIRITKCLTSSHNRVGMDQDIAPASLDKDKLAVIEVTVR